MSNQPFNSFVMLGAMRSGSNLLEKYLNQYPGLVCHGELFHQSFIGTQGCQSYLGIDLTTRDENPQRLLEAIGEADPDKITGYRLFQDHDRRVIKSALQDPLCAKVVLTREPIASFVSLQIALKTQQWLVSDPAHRIEEQIHFELDAYARYLKDQQNFYTQISDNLANSEQPFFEIDYSKLNDVASINRLAAFIGDRAPRTELAQPIKRQNPGTLYSKIVNIEEVRAALDDECLFEAQPPYIKPIVESDTDLSRVYFCKHKDLAFGPVPGVPDLGVQKWLTHHNKHVALNGFTSHRFMEWQHGHPHSTFFSVVRHPVLRAYNAFMNKIFATNTGGYISIRQSLENQFGLLLPQGNIRPNQPQKALTDSGYGLEAHKISFKLFLIFVAANLGNETKIRQDGKWQLQTEIIRRYRVLHPEVIVLREETLRKDLLSLEHSLKFPHDSRWQNEREQKYAFEIGDVYDEEIEALASVAYAADYAAYSYGNLSSL